MEFYIGATHWLDATSDVFDAAINLLIKAISKTTGHQEKETLYFSHPTLLDALDAEKYGYDIQRIAMETI